MTVQSRKVLSVSPPGVAGAVRVTAPSAASFGGVDFGLRCRSPVVRLIALFLRRVQVLKQRSHVVRILLSVGIVSTSSCMSHSLVA